MAFGGLLLVSVLLDDLAARIRVPDILMVLLLGLLIENHIGVVGDQQITLLSLNQAQQISQAALVLVLFFGGLTTNWTAVRSVIKPAARLATVGVLITAALNGGAGFALSAASFIHWGHGGEYRRLCRFGSSPPLGRALAKAINQLDRV